MTLLVLDTSVAVPLVVRTHAAHESIRRWWSGQEVTLCGHARVETYSVLTRLPGDLRHAPADAALLIRTRFPRDISLSAAGAAAAVELFAELGVAGGAVYDGLVALAAVEHDAVLVTRDLRARLTYELLGARVTALA